MNTAITVQTPTGVYTAIPAGATDRRTAYRFAVTNGGGQAAGRLFHWTAWPHGWHLCAPESAWARTTPAWTSAEAALAAIAAKDADPARRGWTLADWVQTPQEVSR
jgi:hypothetical protein